MPRPCTVDSITLSDPQGHGYPFPETPWGFNVTAGSVAAPTPSIDSITIPRSTSLHSAGTVLNTLSNQPTDATCFWNLNPEMVMMTPTMLNACGISQRYWAFVAGINDPGLVAHGGGYINPLGRAEPLPGELDGFSHDRLFGNTLFPCGLGHIGLTICPDGDPTLDAGGFVAISVSVSTPLGLEPDGRTFTISFASAGGSTYLLDDGGSGWRVSSNADTTARAIARGDSLTLVIPQAELPVDPLRYVLSIETDGTTVSQPEVPVVGMMRSPVTINSDSPVGAETPQQFFAALSHSVTSGDIEFALDRLHPVVTEAFGTATCEATLSRRDRLGIDVLNVGGVADFVYEVPGGRSFTVLDALSVTIQLAGQDAPIESHIVATDDGFRWFASCT